MESASLIDTYSTMFTPLKVKALITEIIFLKIFRQILMGFLMLVVAIWSISMIRMGILYQNDCPYGNDNIPHSLQNSLIILGASLLGLISSPIGINIFEYLENLISLIENRDSWRFMFYCTSQVLTVFFFGLLFAVGLVFCITSVIAGNIHVYGSKNVKLTFTNSSSEGYCDKTFFLFSFCSFMSIYIVIGVFFMIGFSCCFCLAFEEIVKEQRPKNSSIKHQENRNVPTNTKIE